MNFQFYYMATDVTFKWRITKTVKNTSRMSYIKRYVTQGPSYIISVESPLQQKWGKFHVIKGILRFVRGNVGKDISWKCILFLYFHSGSFSVRYQPFMRYSYYTCRCKANVMTAKLPLSSSGSGSATTVVIFHLDISLKSARNVLRSKPPGNASCRSIWIMKKNFRCFFAIEKISLLFSRTNAHSIRFQ